MLVDMRVRAVLPLTDDMSAEVDRPTQIPYAFSISTGLIIPNDGSPPILRMRMCE